MKACPRCGRLYPDDSGFCPVDGGELVSATNAPPDFSVEDARIGTMLFDRYHLRRVVADGGMGRVYEALDIQERRNVAVKILHESVARDPVQVERFRREFEISAHLPHQHIAQVFDFRTTSSGDHALVMEFLFGEELRGTLDREQILNPARLVRMVSQVAIALDAAHALKCVHRDLKPDNLFLCQTSEGDIVKVLDFGSVKDTAKGAKQLTQLGTTIGSPYYMAPEQAQALDTLDHRADIWSMGAIVFECLTGQVPFPGTTGALILIAILTQNVPMPVETARKRGIILPARMDDIVERALRKTPSLRYQSMGAFADALGLGWGLSGSHLVWAHLQEDELAQQIGEHIMNVRPDIEVPQLRSAEDSFFGGRDPLAESVRSRPFSRAPSRGPGPVTDAALSVPGLSQAKTPSRAVWAVVALLVLLGLGVWALR
jgi:serine/threonine protein kinase